jgi:DNA-binding HxlR family transcriptional regulator
MGRGLSKEQMGILESLHSQDLWRENYLAYPVDPSRSASLSRTLARLVRRGLVEKYYFRFDKRRPGLLRGRFQWRLTKAGEDLSVNFRRQKLTVTEEG